MLALSVRLMEKTTGRPTGPHGMPKTPSINPLLLIDERGCLRTDSLFLLLYAVRNGKRVSVMLELRARFDEEANLDWKQLLEDEGVKVVIGHPDRKVHANLCIIKKQLLIKVKNLGLSVPEISMKIRQDFMATIVC